MNKFAAKGAILLRIIQFILSLSVKNVAELQYSLDELGRSHAFKQIRPWQYSIFIQCLLNTISLCLGAHATHTVMKAWTNVFAYVMRRMLPPAIKGQVVVTEMSCNVSSDIGSAQASNQIESLEETKQLRKNALLEGSGTGRSSARPSELHDTFNATELPHIRAA